ncbi:hypothetical protein RchiOBHm_Chr5g0072971 [Rosa chinensis]|uniref:Uncharacterized protein n=1 Tax=Rosa chinensis TaxID=74649 RepID=A0A2P6QKS7_ROSCH|nr:hypothetical protein RchiOBHm_Chr5g0072971 [Rosa chinensis]
MSCWWGLKDWRPRSETGDGLLSREHSKSPIELASSAMGGAEMYTWRRSRGDGLLVRIERLESVAGGA